MGLILLIVLVLLIPRLLFFLPPENLEVKAALVDENRAEVHYPLERADRAVAVLFGELLSPEEKELGASLAGVSAGG